MGEEISKSVYGEKGFVAGIFLSKKELLFLQKEVRKSWLERIKEVAPNHFSKFQKIDMRDYHTLSYLLKDENVWEKTSRLFSKPVTDTIKNGGLIKFLKKGFCNLEIGDVCPQLKKSGVADVYWRIVRPDSKQDVGPLHKDLWFWQVGDDSKMPLGKDRVKVWIALFCESNKAGLRVVAGSHLKEYKYHAEKIGDLIKPVFDGKEEDLDIKIIPTIPGEVIIFNDGLLHGGVLGGSKTRVSVEFTLFVDKFKMG